MRPSTTERRLTTGRSLLRAAAGFVVGCGLAVSGLHAQQPTGGEVVSGTATIATAPNLTTVTADNNSVLRWGSFDVGAGETVRFVQPGADARVMNWIGGLTPSQIDGSLLANGQVYLLNPQGVYFGQSAVVDVGRLYAVGGSLSKEDYLNGIDRFTGLTGAVNNVGSIRGEMVALIGRSVANTGSIVSTGGFIGLASGDQVLLGQDGSSIFVDAGRSADAPAAGTGVANSGTIDAGRGTAVLAAGDFYSIAITHDGKLAGRDIKLQGQGRGDVLVSGSIDASANAAGETGGRVEITGERVGLLNGASINASGPAGGGTILVGGDFQGKNPDIRNAYRTYVGQDVTLKADAISNGHGGKVIIWADDITRFFGSISARGGALSGNGGFVEVSGKRLLDFKGMVTTLAPNGLLGTLLLDPDNIIVATGGGQNLEGTTGGGNVNLLGFNEFTTLQSDTFTIDPVTLNALGATVTLQAAVNLTITDAVNLATASAGFIGQAGNNIVLTNGITTNGGVITLTANDAGGPASGTGSITGGGALISAGGAVSLNATTMTLGPINSGAGLITINNTGAATQTGVFAGSGGLTKTGGGTLTLSQANTYTGLTTINNGPVDYAASNVIATGAVTVTGGFGALNLGAFSDTVGTVTLVSNGFITSTSGVLTTTGTYAMEAGTVSAILAGAVPLNKTTSGTVTLSGLNTYTGATSIQEGTLSVNTIGSVGAASALGQPGDVASGTIALGNAATTGTLTYTGTGATTDRVINLAGTTGGGVIDQSGAGLLKFNSAFTATGVGSKTLTLQGSTAGTGEIGGAIVNNSGTDTTALTKAGTGGWALSATNTFTGTTTVSAGTLTFGHATNTLDDTSSLVVSGGTVALGTNNDTVNGVQLTSGSITSSTGTLTSGTAFAMESGSVSAILGGTLGLNKTTGSTVTLSGVNTYTGGTTISAGVLRAEGSGSLSGTGAIALNAGVLQLAGNTAQVFGNAVTVGGDAQITSDTITVGAGVTHTLGALSIGAQTLTVARGSNATSGVGGITLGATSLTGGATVSTSANALTTLGSVTGTGNSLTVKGAGNSSLSSGLNTAAAGTLTKQEAGTLTLAAAGDYTGATDIQAGTLVVTSNDALGTNAAGTTVADGATLDVQATYSTAEALALSGTLATSTGTSTYAGAVTLGDASSTINVGGTQLTLSAAIGDGGNARAISKTGAGNLVLSATNTYTGSTTVSAGTLTLGHATNTLADASNLVVSGGTVALGTNNDTVNGVQLISGSISSSTGTLTSGTAFAMESGSVSAILGGTIGLTKSTGGTVTLSGANTYTGDTTIAEGTLLVGAAAPSGSAGALGNATSAILLGDTAGTASASLLTGGAFTVGRAITVRSGSSGTATIGGNTADSSTFSGAVTLGKGASLTAAAGGTTTFSGAGTISDGAGSFALTLAGVAGSTLNLNGVVTVDTLATTGAAQNIALTANGGTITNAVTFGNTGGTLLLGQAGGTQTYTGGLTATAPSTVTLNGTISSPGATQTYGPVALDSDVALSASTVTFNGAVTGTADSLGITGNAVFGDATDDSVTGLSTLSVSGATTINTDTITSAGTQTYTGAVTVGNDTTLGTTGSTVTFGSTIDSEASEANDLTVGVGAGSISLGGAVGSGTNGALGVLTLSTTSSVTLPAITAGSFSVTAAGVGGIL